MASKRRLIDAWRLVIDLAKLENSGEYDPENVLAVIASQNTIDADPVVHGRWIDAREYCGDYMCSNCDALYGTNKFNYCPNCGAKMDGERKDND